MVSAKRLVFGVSSLALSFSLILVGCISQEYREPTFQGSETETNQDLKTEEIDNEKKTQENSHLPAYLADSYERDESNGQGENFARQENESQEQNTPNILSYVTTPKPSVSSERNSAVEPTTGVPVEMEIEGESGISLDGWDFGEWDND